MNKFFTKTIGLLACLSVACMPIAGQDIYSRSESVGLRASSDFDIKDGVLIKYNGTDAVVTIPETVVTIGKRAFYFKEIVSVTIPGSVKTIEEGAFASCLKLASVNIPNSVTSIGVEAFQLCNELSSATIGTGVTHIGSKAFAYCQKLAGINVSSGNTAYSFADGALYDKNKTLLHSCMYSKTGMFTVPETVTVIGEYAFYNCSNLTGIVLPGSLTAIGDFAFYDAVDYQANATIAIPRSVTGIGRGAFAYACFKAINVDGNNPNYSSVDGVLYNKDRTTLCAYPYSKYEKFTVPGSVTTIGDYAFYGVTATNNTVGVTVTFDIPASVTAIGDYAFSYTSYDFNSWGIDAKGGITSFTGGKNVKSIGEGAFSDCALLVSFNIPESVTGISRLLFAECSSLASVTIPWAVTGIGSEAFYNCTSLANVTVEWGTPLVLSLQENPFSGVSTSGVTLHVPVGAAGVYKAASIWGGFRIVDDYVSPAGIVVPDAVSGVTVSCSGGILTVDSPVAETVTVYGISGAMLLKVQKPAGVAAFPVGNLPNSIILVSGNSGWTGKVIKN